MRGAARVKTLAGDVPLISAIKMPLPVSFILFSVALATWVLCAPKAVLPGLVQLVCKPFPAVSLMSVAPCAVIWPPSLAFMPLEWPPPS